jgi:predicted permease
MIRDFLSGYRQFRHKPFFCALIVLLVAVGIGANILIFGFIDTLLLKPLPVRNPANLWMLESNHRRQIDPNLDFSYGQFEELESHKNLFSAITAEQAWGSAAAYPSVDNNGVRRVVMTQMVAPNYFDEMAVGAVLGRVLIKEDAEASSNVPALLSYQFWQSRYGGRKDVLGRTIRIKDYPFTIVGVLPRDFHSVDIERAPDVRLPISAALLLHGRPIEDLRGEYREGFHIFVRLRPGISPSLIEPAAGPQIRKILCNEFLLMNASQPKPYPPDYVKATLDYYNEGRLSLVPIGQGLSRLRKQFARALQLLMAGVAVLLITVCANVAGLLLARGEERRKDLALRLSIGARRWQLLRQLMIENLCLAIPGALGGWILAFLLSPWLLSVLPPVRSLDQYASPQILAVTPDLRLVLFAWLAILVSICFFGLFPAWRATRLDLTAELKGASVLAAQSVTTLLPVTVQIALSVLLLSAGGVMLRTYWNLDHLNPGFDQEHVVSFTLGMKDAGLTKPQARAYLSELEERIQSHSQVRATSYSFLGLMRGSGQKMTLNVAGARESNKAFMNASTLPISPDYFETLGIPLLEGRTLNSHDRDIKPAPVVVNRALANLLFPRSDPLGRLLVAGNNTAKPPGYQIVGVVETSKYRAIQEHDPPIMYGLTDDEDYGAVMYVRTLGDPLAVMRPVQDEIRKMGRGVPLIEARTLEQEVRNSLWQERLVASLACFFSFVALLLAGIGLYGTLTYSVARRKRELGIRLAVGAQIRHILATVCGRMTWAVGIGVLAGWLVSAIALRFANDFLFEVKPFDKLSFSAATVTVLLCAGLAALIPSWRAIHTNASSALREQ